MSQTYPLPLPTLTLTIAGAARTNELISRTLQIRKVLGDQVDTARFSIKLMESWRGAEGAVPVVGDELTVVIQTGANTPVTEFGGVIARVRQTRIAYQTWRYDIDAVDYSALLSRVLLNETFFDQTASEIATDVVRRFAPGLSTSGIAATSENIKAITFARQYPAAALSELAKIAGRQTYVDASRVVWFVDPWALPASPNEVKDASENFFDISIEPQLDQVRNRVTVLGGAGPSEAVRETFVDDGQDRPFDLGQKDVLADMAPLISGALAVNFMRVDGQPQVVGISDVVTDQQGVDFILDKSSGLVWRSSFRDVVRDGQVVEFRYRYQTPISAQREDLASQASIAVVDGTDYDTVMRADNPHSWWRLADVDGSVTAVNAITTSLNGTYYSGANLKYPRHPVSGPLTGGQGAAARFTDGSHMQVATQIALGPNQYSIEAWVKTSAGQSDAGVVGEWVDDQLNWAGANGRGAVILVSGGRYCFRHQNLGFVTKFVPTATAYDHVVLVWSGGTAPRFYCNKQTQAFTVAINAPVEPPVGSGIEVANWGYGANPHGLEGDVAEAAVYQHVLPEDRIARHYDAGRYGGVREVVTVDNSIASFEQADRKAQLELQRFSSPLTEITFGSYVSGWEPGVLCNINVSGIGITWSGQSVIQDVSMRSVGAQRFLYNMRCVGARFNLVDYWKQLSELRTPVRPPTSVINVMVAFEPTTEIAIPVLVGAATDSPADYYVAPDWGTSTKPYGRCELSEVSPTG